jgi:hypothetical protein
MPDRDAYYWRVRFGYDGKYLGVALGVIDGRGLGAEDQRRDPLGGVGLHPLDYLLVRLPGCQRGAVAEPLAPAPSR